MPNEFYGYWGRLTFECQGYFDILCHHIGFEHHPLLYDRSDSRMQLYIKYNLSWDEDYDDCG